ncbi:beta-glucanase precursor [Kiritimatiellaeota bacterium B1221]|nr:beta-glucanase precursor [Kiritimatiellaeota bacterium B1221]
MKKWISLIGCMSMLVVAATVTAQDFGDFSSQTLTGKAWEAYGNGDLELALKYTAKCKEMFLEDAKKQQKEQAALEVKPTGEAIHEFWALNDVGTCLYIEGQVKEKQEKIKEALAAYKILVEELSLSQCWDEKGWFWKPADAANGRIKQLEFDAMLD